MQGKRMQSKRVLPVLLLAVAATASVSAQQEEQANAACAPLPLPPGGKVSSSDNGVTNLALLDTLVKEVDSSRVFPDSKMIVDMPLKALPEEVAAAFDHLQLPADPQQRNQTLNDFVQEWLLPAGSEMEGTSTNFTAQLPPDWFDALPDPEIRDWVLSLYEIWGRLTRQLSPDVSRHPELYTMLPVPNPFVVPGAQFREVYYWDTFWVLDGLLSSNLTTLAEDIIRNLIYLMRTYGHIPNGIRTYYINRSQPPLFSEMVRIVYEATGNGTLLSEALPALLREHTYFTSSPKQVVALGPDGRQFNVSRYFANWTQPRPESYIEDVETVRQAGLNPDSPEDPAVRRLWQELASGAESGWDFSTRWFANGQNLTTIRTTSIIPADLNAYLLQMEENIAKFAAQLGCAQVEQEFRRLAADRREALNALFFNTSSSQWHDLICTPAGTAQAAGATAAAQAAEAGGAGEEEAIRQGRVTQVCHVKQNPAVFASNWIPLWTGAADAGSQQALAVVEALNTSGLYGVGGVAVSLIESGQQWDYPNVWPPIQWMLIDGTERFGGAPGDALARAMTASYLNTVFATWEQTGRMFEKFSSTQIGRPGSGGEYEVVDGFGWTNGAVLNLLGRFGFE